MTEATGAPICEPNEWCIRPLLRRAYGLFWEHAKLLVAAHAVILVVLLVGNQMLTIGGNVLLGPFFLGLYNITAKITRNEDTEFYDLLSGFEYFLPAFVANILIHIIAFIAGWFLFVPALIALLSYSATYLFLLERNLGFWDAMEASRRMVWGNFRRWFAVGAIILLVNLAGALCAVVGLLVTLPFSHLLITLAYEEERAAAKAQEDAPQDHSAAPDLTGARR